MLNSIGVMIEWEVPDGAVPDEADELEDEMLKEMEGRLRSFPWNLIVRKRGEVRRWACRYGERCVAKVWQDVEFSVPGKVLIRLGVILGFLA